MSQESYNVEMDVAFEGMLADSGRHDALSKVIEGAGLDFGLGCTYGTEEGQIKALSAITDKFAGCIIHKHVEDGVLVEKSAVSLMRKGRMYVKVEEAVAEGDPVHCRAIAPGAEVVGAFRKSQDGVNTLEVKGAEFRSSAAAGGLAIIDFNLPV